MDRTNHNRLRRRRAVAFVSVLGGFAVLALGASRVSGQSDQNIREVLTSQPPAGYVCDEVAPDNVSSDAIASEQARIHADENPDVEEMQYDLSRILNQELMPDGTIRTRNFFDAGNKFSVCWDPTERQDVGLFPLEPTPQG